MASNSRDRSNVMDGVLAKFPETGGTILALASLMYFSNGPMAIIQNEFDAIMHSDLNPDLSEEGVAKAMNSLAGGFNIPSESGRQLALDYRGPFNESARFCEYTHDFDMRPMLDTVLLVSAADGSPQGLIPLPEGVGDMTKVCEYMRDFDGVIVTDRIEYSDTNVRALDRWGTDWLLTQPPFPPTAPAVNAKMSYLKQEEREFETCKVRYDKHWLFRFTDLGRREYELSAIKSRVKDRHEAERLSKGAGVTDAISSQSFDIRRVRELMDIREKCDVNMRAHWRQMGACGGTDRNRAFVTLCLEVLSEMIR